MPRSSLCLVTQDVLSCHRTLTVTAVVTVTVLFVDFLTVRMIIYGFSVMNVYCGCTPRVDIESGIPDVFLYDNC